jgi:hypothetical protein
MILEAEMTQVRIVKAKERERYLASVCNDRVELDIEPQEKELVRVVATTELVVCLLSQEHRRLNRSRQCQLNTKEAISGLI